MPTKRPSTDAPPAARNTRIGKRSDPAYGQHSIWLPRDLFARVSKRLVIPGGRLEFSALVESLLRDWLKATRKE